jgi:hypothetical protein
MEHNALTVVLPGRGDMRDCGLGLDHVHRSEPGHNLMIEISFQAEYLSYNFPYLSHTTIGH